MDIRVVKNQKSLLYIVNIQVVESLEGERELRGWVKRKFRRVTCTWAPPLKWYNSFLMNLRKEQGKKKHGSPAITVWIVESRKASWVQHSQQWSVAWRKKNSQWGQLFTAMLPMCPNLLLWWRYVQCGLSLHCTAWNSLQKQHTLRFLLWESIL